MKSPRPKYATSSILLISETQQAVSYNKLMNAPLDPDRPLEMVLREQVKARGMDANARMWAGPLKDIASQAWYKGAQYSAEVWHSTFKRLYLPEEFDPDLCKEGYVKWAYDRDGERVLVGSTTQLTIKGFSVYLQKIEADGANMGVLFSASPRDER